ncbi:hypothetical protein BDV97DRAFT_361598 [Delphinella strobiligena]|nr:hypothetical protein BDV97DRAFT_361598 [Delphinella strobiligena]
MNEQHAPSMTLRLWFSFHLFLSSHVRTSQHIDAGVEQSNLILAVSRDRHTFIVTYYMPDIRSASCPTAFKQLDRSLPPQNRLAFCFHLSSWYLMLIARLAYEDFGHLFFPFFTFFAHQDSTFPTAVQAAWIQLSKIQSIINALDFHAVSLPLANKLAHNRWKYSFTYGYPVFVAGSR